MKSSDVGGLAISSVSAVNRINAATVIESAAHSFHSITYITPENLQTNATSSSNKRVTQPRVCQIKITGLPY